MMIEPTKFEPTPELPTTKQVEYAKLISGKMHIPLPTENTRKAYQDWLSKNVPNWKRHLNLTSHNLNRSRVTPSDFGDELNYEDIDEYARFTWGGLEDFW